MNHLISLNKSNISIEKIDMVSLVIDQSLIDVLQHGRSSPDRMGYYGIIKSETIDEKMILSFVDSKSRDELFELLIQEIEKF